MEKNNSHRGSLQVNVESNVKNAQTLNSGEVSILFEEVHRDGAGAPLKVPNLFTIAIPVFYGGELYRIAARLRYRVSNAKITWSYQARPPGSRLRRRAAGHHRQSQYRDEPAALPRRTGSELRELKELCWRMPARRTVTAPLGRVDASP